MDFQARKVGLEAWFMIHKPSFVAEPFTQQGPWASDLVLIHNPEGCLELMTLSIIPKGAYNHLRYHQAHHWWAGLGGIGGGFSSSSL